MLPSDSTHLDTLLSDEYLLLNEYPLDKPVIQYGEYIPTPENPAGYSWLYSVVPIDYVIPSMVQHEVIDFVHIPEYPSEDEISPDSADYYGKLMAVELYSMYLCGHLSEEEADDLIATLEQGTTQQEQTLFQQFINSLKSVKLLNFITPAYAKKANPVNWCWGCIWNKGWRPSGIVTFTYDNLSDPFDIRKPVKGLKIEIQAGIKSIIEYTNDQGSFRSARKFGSKVTYTARFRSRGEHVLGRRYFRIVESSTFGSTFKRHLLQDTKNPLEYNYNLVDNVNRANNLHEVAACIFIAGHDFYHDQNTFGRPPDKLRINLYNTHGRANHNTGRYNFTQNPIRMYLQDENVQHNMHAERAISVTLHELAHASHFNLNQERYNISDDELDDKIIKESWALFVEHHLTRRWFPDYDESRQDWTWVMFNSTSGAGKYTALFFDLVDMNGASTVPVLCMPNSMPCDHVGGYTISELELALATRPQTVLFSNGDFSDPMNLTC